MIVPVESSPLAIHRDSIQTQQNDSGVNNGITNDNECNYEEVFLSDDKCMQTQPRELMPHVAGVKFIEYEYQSSMFVFDVKQSTYRNLEIYKQDMDFIARLVDQHDIVIEDIEKKFE